MQLINDTQFAVERSVDLDKEGNDTLLFIVKATYDIAPSGELNISEKQLEIEWADVYRGEPGTTSLYYEADVTWSKLATDVILIGHAYPQRPGDRKVDVLLRVGNLRKVVRVFGDRHWQTFMGITTMSAPKPFEKIPLIYELAFGGADLSSLNPRHHDYEPLNPVGLGFRAKHSKLPLNKVRLPNIENPKHLIKKPTDRPSPSGYGFIVKHWMPRRQYAGTYDKKWMENRMPLLPDDFDERFYSAATPGLTANCFLSGGETVEVLNASHTKKLHFKIPKVLVKGSVLIDAKLCYLQMRLDTVIINSDSLKLILVWHGSHNVHKEIGNIRWVRAEVGAPENAASV